MSYYPSQSVTYPDPARRVSIGSIVSSCTTVAKPTEHKPSSLETSVKHTIVEEECCNMFFKQKLYGILRASCPCEGAVQERVGHLTSAHFPRHSQLKSRFLRTKTANRS